MCVCVCVCVCVCMCMRVGMCVCACNHACMCMCTQNNLHVRTAFPYSPLTATSPQVTTMGKPQNQTRKHQRLIHAYTSKHTAAHLPGSPSPRGR